MKFKLVKKLYKKIIAGSASIKTDPHNCYELFDNSFITLREPNESSCGRYSKDDIIYGCYHDNPFGTLDEDIQQNIFYNLEIEQKTATRKCLLIKNRYGLSISSFLNNIESLIEILIDSLEDIFIEHGITSELKLLFLKQFFIMIKNNKSANIYTLWNLEDIKPISKTYVDFIAEIGLQSEFPFELFSKFVDLILKSFNNLIIAIAAQIQRIMVLLFMKNYMYDSCDDREYLVIIEEANRNHLGKIWDNNKYGRLFIYIYLANVDLIKVIDVENHSKIRSLIFQNSVNPLGILNSDLTRKELKSNRNLLPSMLLTFQHKLSITPILDLSGTELKFLAEYISMLINSDFDYLSNMYFNPVYTKSLKEFFINIPPTYMISESILTMKSNNKKLILDQIVDSILST